MPAVTNATGDYVVPNVTPGTYTVEITMDQFRTVRQTGVSISGGDRVTVATLTLEPGGASETVNVISEAAAHPGLERRTVIYDRDLLGRKPADFRP